MIVAIRAVETLVHKVASLERKAKKVVDNVNTEKFTLETLDKVQSDDGRMPVCPVV